MLPYQILAFTVHGKISNSPTKTINSKLLQHEMKIQIT